MFSGRKTVDLGAFKEAPELQILRQAVERVLEKSTKREHPLPVDPSLTYTPKTRSLSRVVDPLSFSGDGAELQRSLSAMVNHQLTNAYVLMMTDERYNPETFRISVPVNHNSVHWTTVCIEVQMPTRAQINDYSAALAWPMSAFSEYAKKNNPTPHQRNKLRQALWAKITAHGTKVNPEIKVPPISTELCNRPIDLLLGEDGFEGLLTGLQIPAGRLQEMLDETLREQGYLGLTLADLTVPEAELAFVANNIDYYAYYAVLEKAQGKLYLTHELYDDPTITAAEIEPSLVESGLMLGGDQSHVLAPKMTIHLMDSLVSQPGIVSECMHHIHACAMDMTQSSVQTAEFKTVPMLHQLGNTCADHTAFACAIGAHDGLFIKQQPTQTSSYSFTQESPAISEAMRACMIDAQAILEMKGEYFGLEMPIEIKVRIQQLENGLENKALTTLKMMRYAPLGQDLAPTSKETISAQVAKDINQKLLQLFGKISNGTITTSEDARLELHKIFAEPLKITGVQGGLSDEDIKAGFTTEQDAYDTWRTNTVKKVTQKLPCTEDARTELNSCFKMVQDEINTLPATLARSGPRR